MIVGIIEMIITLITKIIELMTIIAIKEKRMAYSK